MDGVRLVEEAVLKTVGVNHPLGFESLSVRSLLCIQNNTMASYTFFKALRGLVTTEINRCFFKKGFKQIDYCSIRAAIKNGNLIEAIKIYRTYHNCGLVEARDFIWMLAGKP